MFNPNLREHRSLANCSSILAYECGTVELETGSRMPVARGGGGLPWKRPIGGAHGLMQVCELRWLHGAL